MATMYSHKQIAVRNSQNHSYSQTMTEHRPCISIIRYRWVTVLIEGTDESQWRTRVNRRRETQSKIDTICLDLVSKIP